MTLIKGTVPSMGNAYDVVVVGGGLNGCSTAYWLASDPDFDGRILVVERDPTYANAPSAKATGGIRQQFSTPENIRIGLFGASFVKRIDEHLGVDGDGCGDDERADEQLLDEETGADFIHDGAFLQRHADQEVVAAGS